MSDALCFALPRELDSPLFTKFGSNVRRRSPGATTIILTGEFSDWPMGSIFLSGFRFELSASPTLDTRFDWDFMIYKSPEIPQRWWFAGVYLAGYHRPKCVKNE